MATKVKPCTLGPRHKWEFVRNTRVSAKLAQTFTLTLRGLYRCACGETKYGAFRREVKLP